MLPVALLLQCAVDACCLALAAKTRMPGCAATLYSSSVPIEVVDVGTFGLHVPEL
jgi:hypothetical protein